MRQGAGMTSWLMLTKVDHCDNICSNAKDKDNVSLNSKDKIDNAKENIDLNAEDNISLNSNDRIDNDKENIDPNAEDNGGRTLFGSFQSFTQKPLS